MVQLTNEDKRECCAVLAKHLVKLRALLGVTQVEFGNLCGFSRTRVSQIENGAVEMTWSQFTSILFVCGVYQATKEYLYANCVITPRLMQFFQRKDENIPPETNIIVRKEIIDTFKNKMNG